MRLLSMRNLIFALFMVMAVTNVMYAGLEVVPKYIFLESPRRSVPIHINNSGDKDLEVWIETKYGYVSSDDTGKITIVLDTTISAEDPSAAGWVKAFPERFILGAGESQTVRFAAYPPPGLVVGEYWARVLITGKPRKDVAISKGQAGMTILQRVGVPFHYRNGKVGTGLDVASANVVVSGNDVDIMMKLTKTGNASYWGSRIMRMISQNGTVVRASTRNVVVYKTLTLHDKLDRAGIASGVYLLEFEFITGKRNDFADRELVQSSPVRSSVSVVIP